MLYDASLVPSTGLDFRLNEELNVVNIDKDGIPLQVMLGALRVDFTALGSFYFLWGNTSLTEGRKVLDAQRYVFALHLDHQKYIWL